MPGVCKNKNVSASRLYCPAVFKAVSLVVLILWLTGCMQDNIVINLNPDGSGTIEETVLMGHAFIDALASIGRSAKVEIPPEERTEKMVEATMNKAKGYASDFGENVRFASAKPVITTSAVGCTALYIFDDISKITVNRGLTHRFPSNAREEKDPKSTISFAFTKGETARLVIHSPPVQKMEEKNRSDNSLEEARAEVKNIMRNTRVSIVFNFAGDITDTNASYRSARSVTLFDLDLNPVVDDPAIFKRVLDAQPESMEETISIVQDAKGQKIEKRSPLYVSFKQPAK